MKADEMNLSAFGNSPNPDCKLPLKTVDYKSAPVELSGEVHDGYAAAVCPVCETIINVFPVSDLNSEMVRRIVRHEIDQTPDRPIIS